MSIVKYNNNSISDVTSGASLVNGAMTHIKTLTASSSATLSFVDGTSDVVLDSTYPIYIFKFIGVHPATDGTSLTFNMSVDTGSNYNVTKTTSAFKAYHNEGDSATGLGYDTGDDLAQSTSFSILTVGGGTGNDNDENISGELILFNPSSTTFVKHFMSRVNNTQSSGYSIDGYSAGYGNTTSAVDAIQFKFASGNIDSGTIKLYGIKDS
tara:strand:+ start:627 stop:1256 length:630 start_codon:yes stop_codon:yes gene_type:complete